MQPRKQYSKKNHIHKKHADMYISKAKKEANGYSIVFFLVNFNNIGPKLFS